MLLLGSAASVMCAARLLSSSPHLADSGASCCCCCLRCLPVYPQVAGQLSPEDKELIERSVNEALQWLEANQLGEKEEFDDKQKVSACEQGGNRHVTVPWLSTCASSCSADGALRRRVKHTQSGCAANTHNQVRADALTCTGAAATPRPQELESTCSPIISRMYQAAGGAAAGEPAGEAAGGAAAGGPRVEEVD